MSSSRKASRPIDECLFSSSIIDVAELRRIASQGIVDQGSHRGVAWRVLLGYLPPNRNEWNEILRQSRSTYDSLVARVFEGDENGTELRGHHGKKHQEAAQRLEKLKAAAKDNENTKAASASDETAAEKESKEQESSTTTKDSSKTNGKAHHHNEMLPSRIREQWKKSGRESNVLEDMSGGINRLLVDKHLPEEEAWAQFYENASLLDEIRKDVVRTHPDLFFFLEPEQSLGQRRYAAMERILFVWAKLNKNVAYVQGMNEIVGTMYFVLANDFNEEWACQAEADTYFMFEVLMEEMRDVFVPALDDADTGIQGRINNMHALLSLHDPEVSSHLEECGIHASFYAIRWLTTLLSREFLVPDTIRLWDSMFASTHKDNFLRYVCVTMVMLIRKDLLKGDFSACLRLLQSYPPACNLDALLESSRALWIYESQVTLACHKGGISLSQALMTISPPPSVVMAYGLPGGIAVRRTMPSQRPAEQQEQSGGRAFFNGAKDFLGGLGREVANNMANRRSNNANSSSNK